MRADLIDIITKLLRRKGECTAPYVPNYGWYWRFDGRTWLVPRTLGEPGKRFDAIVIETTGLADPAPVAQTFLDSRVGLLDDRRPSRDSY